jgi:formylglycine-generating enzyme required for sulfatase activity
MSDQPTRSVEFQEFLFLAVLILLAMATTLAIGRFVVVANDPARLGTPDPNGKRWTNSIGMEFVSIPPGTFTVGSESAVAESGERPLQTVTISRPFAMAATEVTQAQWKAVMRGNPSRFQGEDLPVEHVSWVDVQVFLRKLNAKEGTTHYRLPTEAEWEYACWAGTDQGRQGAFGWFAPNSEGRTHPVGQKQPNAWGLYDMLGNVYEWCEDWKGAYPGGSVLDPRGPAKGSARVARGGSWFVPAHRSRPSFRDAFNPEYRCSDLGFRVVAAK